MSIPSLRLERSSTVHTPSKRARKDVLSTEKIREILHRSRGTDASTRRGARLRLLPQRDVRQCFCPARLRTHRRQLVRGLMGAPQCL